MSTTWPDRSTQRRALAERRFDLIVVGGGVVGAGIAWEAALRGLSVAVIEKHDFASGTSSKSSKLLHGGFRYLENFEFGLVFESLAERNHLFEDAPHVARRLPFLFPAFKGGKDKPWLLGAGLLVYDLLALLSRPKRRVWHQRLSPADIKRVEPAMRQEGLQAAYRYTDGLTEDARLVIETFKSAIAAGALALNHVAVEALLKDEVGVITGVACKDQLTGEAFEAHARVVFNATGPWADGLRRMDDPNARPRLRPTKGVHLLTRAFVSEHAVVLRTQWPGEKAPRVMFVIPWQGRTLIGTTDTDHHGPADDLSYLEKDVEASPEEVAYLLNSVNASFDVKLQPTDVIAAFAGWRPLLAPAEAGVSESQVSREHEVFSSKSGLITIAGGKLTGYRAMARQAVEAVVKALEPHPPKGLAPTQVEHARMHGSDLGGLEPEAYAAAQVIASPELPAVLVGILAARHGSHWPVLRAMLAEDPSLATLLSDPTAGDPPVYAVEAAYAVRHEAAMRLDDFLARRTRLYLVAADQALAAAPLAAKVMAAELGRTWTDAERVAWADREVAHYQALVAHGRASREIASKAG